MQKKKENTMKIFVFLFIMFVSTAHSKFQPSILFKQATDEIKTHITTSFCSFGLQLDAGATDLKNICSQLHDLGKQLPKTDVPTGLSNAWDKVAAKALDDACNSPAKKLYDISKKIMKLCQNGAETTASDMTTLSTAISALSTLSTTTLAPTTQSTSTLPPTTQSSSTVAPTTSTPVPTTTQKTTTKKTTTKRTCDQSAIDRCTEDCKKKSKFLLNLGGKCSHSRNNFRTCDCKKIKHCESYKNATCETQCERYKGDICHIPEADLPCICKFKSGSDTYYRLP